MWKLKILIQFILAHLPKGEEINYLLQILNKSHVPEKIAQHILDLANRLRLINECVKLKGSTVLEIGTGWNAISALLFYVMGAGPIYTYDHIPHVRYKSLQNVINQIENHVEQVQLVSSIPKSVIIDRLTKLKGAIDVKTMFERANIIYKAPSDATSTGLPDNSVDIVYTHAVLEHIPERLIHDLTMETKRILRQNGIAYHLIGLHDHYVGFDKKISKVNFLQYPEWIWRFFVKNKISYHNRLREKQFIEIFKSYGARIKMINNKIDPCDLEILKTMKIDRHFSGMTHEELAVYKSEIILSF